MQKRIAFFTTTALIAALCACEPVVGPVEPQYTSVDLTAASSPIPSDFSSEQTVKARYETEILPHYATGTSGFFDGAEGVRIHHRSFEVANEKGAVVLLPGRTEPVLKYAEVILDLNRQGYSVYALDHRGQGESGRMTSNAQMGYVEYFNDYVSDLDTFITTVVRAKPHTSLFLLAHSMGGGISTLYLKDHPGVFNAAAFSAPMIEINTGAFPEFVAYSLVGGICSRGDGKSYGIGQGDFKDNLAFTDAENDVTRSENRFDLKMKMLLENASLKIGGATNRWICESILATAKMRKINSSGSTPILLMQAQDDKIVNPGGQNQYCNRVGTCQKSVFQGSYHEILMERDEIRNEAMTQIARFFNHFSGAGI